MRFVNTAADFSDEDWNRVLNEHKCRTCGVNVNYVQGGETGYQVFDFDYRLAFYCFDCWRKRVAEYWPTGK